MVYNSVHLMNVKGDKVLCRKRRLSVRYLNLLQGGGEQMELSELTAYAEEKYQIQEQFKWPEFPLCSVLCHPQTGKWIALLMRQWNSETGASIERCDLKCGKESLFRFARPYLSAPIRMYGSQWISIAFGSHTEREIVFQLFDRAIALGNAYAFTVRLAAELPPEKNPFRDTALPDYKPVREKIPERLREMKHLYEYGAETEGLKARNFYKQAVFMQDYEDDAPWSGSLSCFYPTYHDLTLKQLRGYFSWRTQIRKGNYREIETSAAYIYIFELLNGVGADTPGDCLKKLKEFEAGYLDAGFGDKQMQVNLHRWMMEYCVLKGLPRETALQIFDPDMIEADKALDILRNPEMHVDEEVFCALCRFANRKILESPVITLDPERGKRLFSEVWRNAAANQYQQTDIFTLCFGTRKTRQWFPFFHVVYYEKTMPADREYVLNECRSFRCRKGIWEVTSFEKSSFDRLRFHGLLHEADALLRRYLKTGRYLKEKPEDKWTVPFIEAVIEADKKAVIEALRPKVTIDLSGLEMIRLDADRTRDSLLTEEEREDADDGIIEQSVRSREAAGHEAGFRADSGKADREYTDETVSGQISSAVVLDQLQIQLLRTLLRGDDGSEIVKAAHMMPSVAADSINDALFDEIGDTVLICEDDRLSLMEDYVDDLEQLLGETNHG